ncbi:metal ABC transporter solute-binding protein, Zn/Mn family [Natronincola ferrireducens]|uniref:Zinc transport system substrate-binding protein n=1 Tax=Natronincola ferrireducens TaxID=393762 RepID=A0A1G8YHX5_9FIRM|nr:zinc ABC transporter substrate-binding protein [Natronincola ferrireducens]SDK02247.1 zinc transport system substrate-binding protein [Natronincola ferrireducens]
MKGKSIKYGIILLILTYIFVGCSPITLMEESSIEELEVQDGEVVMEPRIKMFASFYPLYDFAKKVGGDLVDVSVVVPHAIDPHSFDPSPRIIAQLETADVLIYNGLGMEPWIDGVLEIFKDKNTIIIEANKGLELIKFEEDNGYHHHEHDHHHHDGEYDPHIWMDPINVIKIAEGIKDAFVEIDPENIGYYEENYINFRNQLKNLDKDFIEGLEKAVGRRILVSHSAFGYLANRYNIKEIAVSGVSPHQEPSPGRLAELTEKAKEFNLKYIFFEGLANPRTAEILGEEANLEVLTLYNIEGLTEEQREFGEDYLSLMYKNLENLKKALVE